MTNIVNGTSSPFSWFNSDPNIQFFTTIGLIIMTALAVVEVTVLILKLLKKPKFVFETEIRPKEEQVNDTDHTAIHFWIHVKNEGRQTANECRVILKLLDNTGNNNIVTKLSHQSPKTTFNVKWDEGADKRETIDLIPHANYGSIKVPFRITLAHTLSELESGQPFSGHRNTFESPVLRLDLNSLLKTPTSDDFFINFRIELELIHDNKKAVSQQFHLQVPSHKDEFGNYRAYLNEIKLDVIEN